MPADLRKVNRIGDVPAAIRDGGVVVWSLGDDEPLPMWVAVDALTEAERERAARMRHPLARSHFERGRAVIRSALGLRVGLHPRHVPISVTADGKPVLDDPLLHFNVGHTHGLAVFAVASVPVGIDVERLEADRDFAGLVKRYFAIEEQEQFDRLPDEWKLAGFYRGWTGKEALLKGIGCGVRELQNCAVDLDPRRPPRVLRVPDGTGEWRLTEWDEREWRTSLAVESAGEPGA